MAYGDEHRVYLSTPDIGDMPWLECEKRGCEWSVRIGENMTPSDLVSLELQHDQEIENPEAPKGRTVNDVYESVENKDPLYFAIGMAIEATSGKGQFFKQTVAKYVEKAIDEVRTDRTMMLASNKRTRELYMQTVRVARSFNPEQKIMFKHFMLETIRRDWN